VVSKKKKVSRKCKVDYSSGGRLLQIEVKEKRESNVTQERREWESWIYRRRKVGLNGGVMKWTKKWVSTCYKHTKAMYDMHFYKREINEWHRIIQTLHSCYVHNSLTKLLQLLFHVQIQLLNVNKKNPQIYWHVQFYTFTFIVLTCFLYDKRKHEHKCILPFFPYITKNIEPGLRLLNVEDLTINSQVYLFS